MFTNFSGMVDLRVETRNDRLDPVGDLYSHLNPVSNIVSSSPITIATLLVLQGVRSTMPMISVTSLMSKLCTSQHCELAVRFELLECFLVHDCNVCPSCFATQGKLHARIIHTNIFGNLLYIAICCFPANIEASPG